MPLVPAATVPLLVKLKSFFSAVRSTTLWSDADVSAPLCVMFLVSPRITSADSPSADSIFTFIPLITSPEVLVTIPLPPLSFTLIVVPSAPEVSRSLFAIITPPLPSSASSFRPEAFSPLTLMVPVPDSLNAPLSSSVFSRCRPLPLPVTSILALSSVTFEPECARTASARFSPRIVPLPPMVIEASLFRRTAAIPSLAVILPVLFTTEFLP